MIKGILFDWQGVLVEKNHNDIEKIDYIYNKILQNIASKEEVIEMVNLFNKYEPLWELLPKLSKHFKMCVVNNGPKVTCDYWDKYFGYSEFMGFINSEAVGIEKPNPEIYIIACERLGVKPNEVIYMDDNCGFPEDTEKLNMKFIHWDTQEKGFIKFKSYLSEHFNLNL